MAPVPTAPIPTAPVPMAPIHMLPSTCCYPHAPVPHVPVPHAPIPHAPVPMLPSLKINCFNHTKTNHFNHTIKKFTPVLILRSTFSGISRTFTIFMLEAMWCEGSNPHGVEALWSSFCPKCKKHGMINFKEHTVKNTWRDKTSRNINTPTNRVQLQIIYSYLQKNMIRYHQITYVNKMTKKMITRLLIKNW